MTRNWITNRRVYGVVDALSGAMLAVSTKRAEMVEFCRRRNAFNEDPNRAFVFAATLTGIVKDGGGAVEDGDCPPARAGGSPGRATQGGSET